MTEKQKISRETPGPIAQKFIRSVAKYAKTKVINLNDWRIAKAYNQELEQSYKDKDLSHLDPLHAIYVDAQNRIADFINQFSANPDSRKLNNSFVEAEDEYTPSYPPMSPITNSYFTCWSAFDMCAGVKKETYTSIMIDFCKSLGGHADFINVLKYMQQSRMGLYIVEGNDNKYSYLREIYTNKSIKTHVPCKYLGVPGEIWFVRLLPDPTNQYCDYSVAFTSPYVIIDFPVGSKKPDNPRELMYSEDKWLKFIERNLSRTKHTDTQRAYEHFMKYGLTKFYWLEYIFEAYVNHTSDLVLLTGFPDVKASLPHADSRYERWLG